MAQFVYESVLRHANYDRIFHLLEIGWLAPEGVARTLALMPPKLRIHTARFLGECSGPTQSSLVVKYFTSFMNFGGLELDEALRVMLSGVALHRQATKIDKTLEIFTNEYCAQNPAKFSSNDAAFVLSFSIIMLNTDAHATYVRNKLTKDQFLRGNKGINNGADFDSQFLSKLYDRVVQKEIRWINESVASALQGKNIIFEDFLLQKYKSVFDIWTRSSTHWERKWCVLCDTAELFVFDHYYPQHEFPQKIFNLRDKITISKKETDMEIKILCGGRKLLENCFLLKAENEVLWIDLKNTFKMLGLLV
jgi:Sec7-like guanine-nucleotide exchange factor